MNRCNGGPAHLTVGVPEGLGEEVNSLGGSGPDAPKRLNGAPAHRAVGIPEALGEREGNHLGRGRFDFPKCGCDVLPHVAVGVAQRLGEHRKGGRPDLTKRRSGLRTHSCFRCRGRPSVRREMTSTGGDLISPSPSTAFQRTL